MKKQHKNIRESKKVGNKEVIKENQLQGKQMKRD